jgi:hypothetical protein
VADDLIKGFGERIVKRARLPTAALLALPLVAVAVQYFLFLIQIGFSLPKALDQLKNDAGLFAFLAAIPTVALAFARELQVHNGLDRLLGTRARVGRVIAELMSELASASGYEHPERVTANLQKAIEWFYSYVNEQSVLRTYAFEVWEAYYVSLYLSLASTISFVLCLVLQFLHRSDVVLAFAGLSAAIFVVIWAVRRWSTVPKIMRIPAQQITEIQPSGEVLSEARRRFG